MNSTTKVIISFYFPIEHLSAFDLLVTEHEERLSEMLNILDFLAKAVNYCQKSEKRKTDCQVLLRVWTAAEIIPRRTVV